MNSRSSWCAPWCSWRCSRRVYSWKRRYPILRRSLSYPSISSPQHELRFEQPCTQDLRSCASQDTVQSEQRSLEKRGLIYRTGSFAKGTGRKRLTVLLAAQQMCYSLSSRQRTRDRDCSPPPPHRSRRALLTHRAPTLDGDEEPLFGPRVQDAWEWQVPVSDLLHSRPRKATSLASTHQRAVPTFDHVMPEC